jgi:hypothetical protein
MTAPETAFSGPPFVQFVSYHPPPDLQMTEVTMLDLNIFSPFGEQENLEN